VNALVNQIRHIPVPARILTPSRPTRGKTEMIESSHQARTVFFGAATRLNSEGYTTLRVAGSSRLFDLVAWKKNELLFLIVKRSRIVDISEFSVEIARIVAELREGNIPAEVQFWIYKALQS
jgi:hypothetical protein